MRPARRRRPTGARQTALELLRRVRADDAYANLLLPVLIEQAGLSSADAALATELGYGTLRGQGYYDRVIALAADRPTDRIDDDVLDVLRLGAHQLLATRIPEHAAVDETVRLAPRRATGFANAVLRAISRDTPSLWRDRVGRPLSGREKLAALHSHPQWVVDALADALTADGRGEELEELLAADNLPPRVSLVAIPGLADPSELGPQTGISPLAARLEGGHPARHPLIASGRARVQDEGSQLAALALSRARPVVPGERWLDMCAAPGGKAAVLAGEALLGGAALVANELVPARAGLVRSSLRGFDRPPTVVQGDAARFADEGERFDRILLDAPCTGLGALRRRPEARWRRQPGDLAELVATQTRLLDAAVASLAPGGLLAYVTCSPHLAETREAVAGVLSRHPGLALVDTRAVLQRVAARDLELPAGDAVQLWPHRHSSDAMFIQLLVAPSDDRALARVEA